MGQVIEIRKRQKQARTSVERKVPTGRGKNADSRSREYVLSVVSDLPAFADDPELRCEALIAFYQTLLKQPEPGRTVVASGMFEVE